MQTTRTRAGLPGRELENVPDNPCFGCGPANPEGLHLRFFDDGSTIRTTFTPDERLAGWEGSMNAGFTFLAMMEAVTWALWYRVGPSIPTSDVTASMRAPTLIGKPVIVEARATPERDGVQIDAVALQEGKPTASVRMSARRASPDEARAMASRVPEALRAEWEAVAKPS